MGLIMIIEVLAPLQISLLQVESVFFFLFARELKKKAATTLPFSFLFAGELRKIYMGGQRSASMNSFMQETGNGEEEMEFSSYLSLSLWHQEEGGAEKKGTTI